MKRSLYTTVTLLVTILLTAAGSFNMLNAQQTGTDQNPQWATSRDKYVKMADSLNAWHGTTRDETYKAIDWMEERKEARADRRAFRRQLRLERASYQYRYGYGRNGYYGQNNYGWNNYGYYDRQGAWYGNQGIYRNYNRGRYGASLYDPWRSQYWWR